MLRRLISDFEPVSFIMSILAMGAGIILPLLWWDSNITILLLVALVAFVYGSVVFRLARNGIWLAIFFLIFIAGLGWVRSLENLESGTAGIGFTWFMYWLAGVGVGGTVVHFFFPKKASAKIKPVASDELNVQWQDGKKVSSEGAPSAGSLVKRVESLDGKKRALVSARRGTARMDFCGDAGGAMVVYFSPDTSDENLWSLLTTPGAEHGQVDVSVGDYGVSFNRWSTVALESAESAARHFAATGKADPQLTWYASKDVCERRPLAS